MHQVLFKNSITIAIEKNSEFTFLTKDQIENLVTAMDFQDFNKGDMVIREGSVIGSQFLIVVRGKLMQLGATLAHTFGCLGDKELAYGDMTTMYEHDIIAEADCQVARIGKYEFQQAIGGEVSVVRTQNEVE